jgi:prevent-host-death family protein
MRKKPKPTGKRDKWITATDAAKKFGTLVDRVREEHAVYVVARGGIPVAQIGPVPRARVTVADFVDLVSAHAPLDKDFAKRVAEGVASFNRPGLPENRWDS